MQRGGQLLILLGLILGVITAGLVYSSTKVPEVKLVTKPVLVAVQDIPERVGIVAPMLATREWPVDALPPDFLSSADQAVGKASLTKVYAGEPILAGKLVSAPLAAQLAFLIPPGFVAFSFNVNEASSVSYAVGPGDFIDILVSMKIVDVDIRGNSSQSQATTQLTLQDVRVINVGLWTPPQMPAQAAANQQSSGNQAQPSTITVLVSQQDALVLKYANEEGRLDLALRGYTDHDKVTTDSVYLSYMIDRFKFARPPIFQRAITTTIGN